MGEFVNGHCYHNGQQYRCINVCFTYHRVLELEANNLSETALEDEILRV